MSELSSSKKCSSMKTLIIYHSRDLDGWCSGAIAYRYYKNLDKTADIELRGYDYGKPVSKAEELKFDRIVMLDVSYPVELMSWLVVKPDCEFIWIDHHKSAINEVAEHTDIKQIHGIRNTKYAACELAWFWFYPDTIIPDVVEYLGLYDTFRHKGTNESKSVLMAQYAARAHWNSVESILETRDFFDVSSNLKDKLINEGWTIYHYLCIEAEQIYSKHKVVDFDGFKFGVVNRERFNPINFDIDYHKSDGLDGFACYWDNDVGRTWSLYNDNGKVDCSVICKARGGGGHKGAAGFVQDIIFPPYVGNNSDDLIQGVLARTDQYIAERDKEGNPLVSHRGIVLDMNKESKIVKQVGLGLYDKVKNAGMVKPITGEIADAIEKDKDGNIVKVYSAEYVKEHGISPEEFKNLVDRPVTKDEADEVISSVEIKVINPLNPRIKDES